MSGTDRYINVLNLFTTEKSTWAAHEIASALNVLTSAIYRTICELVRIGIVGAGDGNALSAQLAFIEFDNRMGNASVAEINSLSLP
jgi:DNA-binding IclR family transcriptional regulator